MEGKKHVNARIHRKTPTLLLADDHAIVLDGLRRLLVPEFELVGAVADGRALLESAARLTPDVIVTDVSMPSLNGIEAVRQLKKSHPRCKVVILSMHGEVEIAAEALRAGASAYVLKNSAADVLCDAIWKALNGETYVSPRVARSVSVSMDFPGPKKDNVAQLTSREREVLQLVAEGRTIRGVASILNIAARTVVFHKSNIMDKLGRRTTADLTQYAIQNGLINVLSRDAKFLFGVSAGSVSVESRSRSGVDWVEV